MSSAAVRSRLSSWSMKSWKNALNPTWSSAFCRGWLNRSARMLRPSSVLAWGTVMTSSSSSCWLASTRSESSSTPPASSTSRPCRASRVSRAISSASAPGRPSATGKFRMPAATAATGSSPPTAPIRRRSGCPMPALRCCRTWPITQNSAATCPAQAARIRYGVAIR